MRIITMTTTKNIYILKIKINKIYIAQEHYQLLKIKINKNYIHNKMT